MRVFFYGLFMDENLLRSKGLNPLLSEKGFVPGYGLRIGQRALLIKQEDEKAFGVTFTLPSSDVIQLYAEPSVQDYSPMDVTFIGSTGQAEQVVCYNLPASSFKGSNGAYTKKLAEVAATLGFSPEYIAHISSKSE